MWIKAFSSQEPCDGTCVSVPSPEELYAERKKEFYDTGAVGPVDCRDLFEGTTIVGGKN